jgi:hypothetical protein
MLLEDYPTLSHLTPLRDVRGWSEGDVPLSRRGVSLDGLVAFVNSLQTDSNQACLRGSAFEVSLMNVHCFVEEFVKPLTQTIAAPLYALIPNKYVGPPDLFISHNWNALLVGTEHQQIGTIDALETGAAGSYVWIDFICCNQHRFENIAPDMERIISEIGRIAFAATPVPLLNRSWCLWELLCSERAGVPQQIIVRPGFRNDKILSVNAFFRSFAGVENSQTSSAMDRTDIIEGFLQKFETLEAANAYIDTLLRDKLSHPWYELHERESALQFRPYPWIQDAGRDAAERAVESKRWPAFNPYYTPLLKQSVVLGSHRPMFDVLIGAGMHVSQAERKRYEFEHASPATLSAFRAVQAGETAVLERLLAAGFDVSTRLAGNTLEGMAAGCGRLDCLRVILDKTNPVSADSLGELLRVASDQGHLDVVRWLLERGAKMEAAEPGGWTPLLWAASSGHAEIVKYLLQVGADVHFVVEETKATPLHIAASHGHLEVVELLLDHGAAVSPKTRKGSTPLHYALQNGHVAVARVLLDRGADTCGVTDGGITLTELAQKSKMPVEIVARLEAANDGPMKDS